MPTIDDALLDQAGNAILDQTGDMLLVPNVSRGTSRWWNPQLLDQTGAHILDQTGDAILMPNSERQGALAFDGVDRGAGIYGSMAVDCGTTAEGGVAGVSGVGVAAAFTLECRIQTGNITPLSGHIIVGRYRNGGVAGEAQPVLYIINNTLRALIRDNAGVVKELISAAIVGANSKYVIACDYDGTTFRLYLDGAVVDSEAVTGVEATANDVPFQIGRDVDAGAPGGYPFVGIIDEVRWSNVARYAGKYQPATSPFTSDANTLGLWHLDEDAGFIAKDSSSNAKHGRLIGAIKPTRVESPWFYSYEWFFDNNKVTNPVFDTDTSGWAFNDGIVPTRVADHPNGLGYCLEFADTSNTAKPGATQTAAVPCSPGQVWTAGAWMKQTVAGTLGSLMLRAVYQDGLNTSEQEFTDLVLGTWVWRSFTFVVPAGKTSFSVDIKGNNTYDHSTTGTVRVTEILYTSGGFWVPFEVFNKASMAPLTIWPDRVESFEISLRAIDSLGAAGDYETAYFAPLQTLSPGAIASVEALGFGKAISFDGVNRGANSQAVDCGNSVTGVAGVAGVGAAATFCLEAKVKTGASLPLQIVAARWGLNPANQQVILWTDGANWHADVQSNTPAQISLVGTSAPAINTQYDLACTYDGTTFRLFVNGVLEASVALSGMQAPDNVTPFQIGTYTGGGVNGYPWLGIIDEVRWSNVARYTANYTPSASPFLSDANTLGLWHLDEGSGLVAYDSGPSGKHGTLVGTVLPSRVASPWTTGNAIILPKITLLPGAIASAQALGTPTIVATQQNLSPGGIASAQAFGTATIIRGAVTVFPGGIASGQAFGAVTVLPGARTLLPGGIASAQAFGNPILTAGIFVLPGGIASAQAFGAVAVLPGSRTLSPGAIASAQAFGNPALSMIITVLPSGIATAQAFGNPSLALGPISVLGQGIASAEAFGVPYVNTQVTLLPGGIFTAEALGIPTLQATISLLPGGIATAEAFGFGRALFFDGVGRGANTQGVDCGNSVTGVPGIIGGQPFCLEAKVRTEATIPVSVIAGRWRGDAGGRQPVLWTDGGVWHCSVMDSASGLIDLAGTSIVQPNTKYDIAVTYDGAAMRLYVNGVRESGVALVNAEAADATSKFWIGRDEDPGSPGGAGYPFFGTIDEVRWSNAYRYNSDVGYTPSKTPFIADANTLGLWHFDEDSGVIAYDAGPNAKHGIVSGSVLPARVGSPWYYTTLIPGTVILVPVGIGSAEAFGFVVVIPPGIAWRDVGLIAKGLRLVPGTLILLVPTVGGVRMMPVSTMELIPTAGSIRIIPTAQQIEMEDDIYSIVGN